MNCSGRNGPLRTSLIEEIELMKCQSIAGAFGLVGLLLLISPSFAVEDKAFTESVVIFNTICAKCHEAECSGRLSFDEAFETSSSHILRHFGRASGKKCLRVKRKTVVNQKERITAGI